MTFAFIILWVLDMFSELITLTFQAGQVTRKYAVPAVVALAVVTHMAWEEIAKFYDEHPPFALEMGYN